MEKILLFIPMYNCEKQIVRVLDKLKGETISYFSEILIVNNRSTDRGEQAVAAYIKQHRMQPKVTLVRNCENYGLGGSHKVAFSYAVQNQFDYVVVLHGDDQGDLSNLLPILKKKLYQKYDCCLGARFMKGSSLPGYSAFRTVGNFVYNLLFFVVTGKRIYDLGSGLNMYSTRMLKEPFYLRYPDNLTFNCYMLFAAKTYAHKVMFFPIIWREEDQISNVKMVRQAWNTLKMALGYGVRRKKYLEGEHRAKAVESYCFDVIEQTDEKAGDF